MFKDRNFAAACLFMSVIGVVLFGVMALITPFMQNLLGYPIMTAGFLLGARGVGTLISMMMVGRLMKFVEARTLVFVGLAISAATLYEMINFTTDTSATTIVVLGVIQGSGLGLVFVPLSTVAFTTLPGHLRTSGTSMLTLVRNIGSSVGISMVIANLTSTTTVMHARLTEHVTPFNNALQQAGSMLSTATDQGRALLDLMVTQQATIISYDNTFKLLMVLTLVSLPLVLAIGKARAKPAGGAPEVHAMD
jgi:DHA2 family multidrug resistance protein